MIIEALKQYHLYNRGNNRETIFFSERNYCYFKKKLKSHLIPHIDIISYCLMPNHFHIQFVAKENFDETKFYNSFRTMLSSYTRAINLEKNRIGSLFQQNSKCKELNESNPVDTPFICFNYIHQNPIKSRLVNKFEDWKYSSFIEYYHNLSDLCNLQLGKELLILPETPEEFYQMSYDLLL